MNNDPFKNFKPLNPPQNKKSKSSVPKGDSFIEQIKGIGTSTANSLKTDVVKGTARNIFDQLTGSANSGQVPPESGQNQEMFEKWMKEREEKAAEEARSEERALAHHRRGQEKVLFSFADEKLSREISEVRQEIAMLVKTMGQVEKQIEQAAIQEVVDPGVYHLNFFRKLKVMVQIMRKNLQDASTWMEMQSGRGKRSYYWNQVNKSGTKYSMSSERNVQMGAG